MYPARSMTRIRLSIADIVEARLAPGPRDCEFVEDAAEVVYAHREESLERDRLEDKCGSQEDVLRPRQAACRRRARSSIARSRSMSGIAASRLAASGP